MGGSGSTRRVVVEEVDGSGVVKISDSVVKRIRGEEDTYDTSGSSTGYTSGSTSSGYSSSTDATYASGAGSGATYATGAGSGATYGSGTGVGSTYASGTGVGSTYASGTGVGSTYSAGAAAASGYLSAPASTQTAPSARGRQAALAPGSLSEKEKGVIKDIEAFYTARFKELERRNSELQKITNEQFVKAVQEVEQKFLKHTCSPVCQDIQSRVYECYLENPKHTLNCSAQVRAFSTCVERARQNALLRKS